jgi:predicted nucleotidyltransferase
LPEQYWLWLAHVDFRYICGRIYLLEKGKKMMLEIGEEQLARLCRKYDLSFVVLHGSYANGKALASSDIDVGFLGNNQIIKERFFDVLRDFTSLFGEKLDVVVLNGAEPMISYRVALYGLPLYEKTKGIFSLFKTSAIARYMDSRKFRDMEKSYIRAAIAKRRRSDKE